MNRIARIGTAAVDDDSKAHQTEHRDERKGNFFEGFHRDVTTGLPIRVPIIAQSRVYT